MRTTFLASGLVSPAMYCWRCAGQIEGVETVRFSYETHVFGKCSCGQMCRRRFYPLRDSFPAPRSSPDGAVLGGRPATVSLPPLSHAHAAL